ncbi:UNVERIFIED_CONTAM: hypothetical protein FKN15_054772 [Acipenser sinensis]
MACSLSSTYALDPSTVKYLEMGHLMSVYKPKKVVMTVKVIMETRWIVWLSKANKFEGVVDTKETAEKWITALEKLKEETLREPTPQIVKSITLKEFKAILTEANFKVPSMKFLKDLEASKSLNLEKLHNAYDKLMYESQKQFLNYLFSKENSIWDTKVTEYREEDMCYPLCDYWINSSHNTIGAATAAAKLNLPVPYQISVDCFDGPSKKPIITHGKTFTSEITFDEVVEAINTHAFEVSEFPVILSIEDHCSTEQQGKMAKKFKEVFKDKLLTEQAEVFEDQLPSPMQLKRKIIIKAKQDPQEATAAAADPREVTAAAADPWEATAAPAADPLEATAAPATDPREAMAVAADPRDATAAAAGPREANSGGEPLAMEAAAGAPLLPRTL